jgi:HK97 gp10 family phage protein
MATNLGTHPQALRQSLAAVNQKLAAVTGGDSPTIRLAGLELERAIKLQLSKPGTGRLYERGRTTHQASAPNEPPAPDTGALRSSVGSEVVGGVLRVGVGMPYAPYLEFGTLDAGGAIAPRPFMRPAYESVKDRMTGVVVKDLQQRGRL